MPASLGSSRICLKVLGMQLLLHLPQSKPATMVGATILLVVHAWDLVLYYTGKWNHRAIFSFRLGVISKRETIAHQDRFAVHLSVLIGPGLWQVGALDPSHEADHAGECSAGSFSRLNPLLRLAAKASSPAKEPKDPNTSEH